VYTTIFLRITGFFERCPLSGILKNRKEHNILGTGSVSEMLCSFMFFRIPDDGQKSKNQVILSVIYHHQNPLDTTNIFLSVTSLSHSL
jgi:hypothetical protein